LITGTQHALHTSRDHPPHLLPGRRPHAALAHARHELTPARPRLARTGQLLVELAYALLLACTRVLQLAQLALQLALGVGLDLGQLGLQHLDALLVPLAAALARILRGGAAERAQLAFAPVHALAQLLGGAARLLLAHLQALACRARLKGARSQRVVARRALRQGPLGVRP